LADRGDTESEYEFVSDSEQEPEEGEEDNEEHDEDYFENEQQFNDDDYEERDCEEPHTPVYNSPPPNNAIDSEGETQVHQSLKRRRTVLAEILMRRIHHPLMQSKTFLCVQPFLKHRCQRVQHL